MFTKGKWNYEPDNTDYQDKNHDNGTYRGVIVGGKSQLDLCVMIADCLEGEVEDNAHLIAAAPEMYEALKELMEVIQHSKSQCRGRSLASDALNKAEGK